MTAYDLLVPLGFTFILGLVVGHVIGYSTGQRNTLRDIHK